MKKHLMLMEMHNLRIALLESRMDFLVKTYAEKLEVWYHEVIPSVPTDVKRAVERAPGKTQGEKVINYVASMDPDTAKKNTQWMITVLLRDGMHLEDVHAAAQALVLFNRVKRQLPTDQRDIQKITSLGDLHALLQPFEQSLPVSQRQQDAALDKEMRKQAKIVYDSPGFRILIPKTMAASCYFGVNTKWCTAWGEPTQNRFPNYSSKGPLYIILDKANNKRFQFHFEMDEFKNELNGDVNLRQFCQEYPEVAKFFADMDGGEVETPVGTVGRYTAFLSSTAITFREGDAQEGKGLLRSRQKKTATIRLEDGAVVSAQMALLTDSYRSDFPHSCQPNGDEILEILRNTKVTLGEDEPQYFANWDIFFNNGKWGSLAEVGDTLLALDLLHKWVAVGDGGEEDGNTYVALVTEAGENLWDVLIDNKHNVHAPAPDRVDGVGRPGECLAKLLVAIDAPLQFASGDDRMRTDDWSATDFHEEEAKIIVAHKPSLATANMLFIALGPNDKLVHDKILFNLTSLGFKNPKIVGNHVLINYFDDISDLIEDHGNNTAKNVQSMSEGKEHWDIEGYVDNDTLEGLLDKLAPEEIAKIGAYMLKEYPEEAEELDDLDPTSSREIASLQREVDDDTLSSAVSSAAAAGAQSGAEGEAITALRRAITELPLLYEDKRAKDGWTAELQYDVKVAVAPTIQEVAEALDDDDFGQNYDNWLEWKELEVDVDEPHYGWSDYDEDAGLEVFKEHLFNIIKSD